MTALLSPSIVRAGGKPPPYEDAPERPAEPEESGGEEREAER